MDFHNRKSTPSLNILSISHSAVLPVIPQCSVACVWPVCTVQAAQAVRAGASSDFLSGRALPGQPGQLTGDPDSVKTFLAVSSTREDHHNHHNHPDDHYDDHHDDVLGEATDPECHRPGLQRIMGLRGQDCQGGGGEGPLQR